MAEICQLRLLPERNRSLGSRLMVFGSVPVLACLLIANASSAAAQTSLLQPADLEYRGAFRLPQGTVGASTWGYGGWALTYYPGGDPSGPADGYPGSLYGVGHDWDQLVAEVSIPVPVISASRNENQLPIAQSLQSFADVSGGLINQVSADKLGGLAYLPAQGPQSTGKLYWTVYEYYNAAGVDNDVLGWSGLDLSNPQAAGIWHIGPRNDDDFHSLRTENYLFDISPAWADQHVGGKYLASGRAREAGAFGSSQGPAVFASAPWNHGNPPPDGTEIDAVGLLHYPDQGACWQNNSCHFPGYKACDDWDGGAWITAGSKAAVVIVGSKGLGSVYYGDGRLQDCTSWKGYHCSPYEGQFLFYDPDELAQVALGQKQPWEVVPYAIFRPSDYLWPDCKYQLGGAAFDRDRGIFYVLQKNVDGSNSQPLVHVFEIAGANPPGTFRLSVARSGNGSGTIASDPAGIDCGADCQEDYVPGTVVALTAVAGGGWTFLGWSGDADCLDGAVTMIGPRACTASFGNVPPPSSGLVAAYGFDETGGATAADSSGTGNHGTVAGASWAPAGYFGGALSFDGSGDWVTVPDAPSFDLSAAMTLEAWVKPSALSGWRTALFKETGGGLAYSLYANDNGFRPAAYVDTGGGDQPATGGPQLPIGAWSHLAATWDSTTLRLYVDGGQVASSSVAGILATSSSPLRIGGNAGWGEYFAGLIDEVRVYDRALSAAEIAIDMATPVGGGGGPTQNFCVPYPQSPLYRSRSRQVAADPSDWIAKIQGALAGDEILLADGEYNLNQYALGITVPLTVRGASGDRDAVVILGQGYGTASEGLMIQAADVSVADLTLTGMRNHGISIKGELGAEAPHVYNVHIYDIGTQHIKGTPGDGVHDGVVACSKIGYTPGGVAGDYINAIDIHSGVDWTVRDNEIYNIWGDGTGCEVDTNCGTYQPGGGPSILFWNGSSGTVVERNRIVDSYRGIALGFGSAHADGTVRNNFFYQSTNGGDAGISINGGSNTLIDHNTVLLGGSYPGAIELQGSSALLVRNNLLNQPVWNRGGTTYNNGCNNDACDDTLYGNKVDGTVADLATPGDPHLDPASPAVDFSSAVALAVDDIDGQARPNGARNDAGCDEYVAGGGPPPGDDEFEHSGSGSSDDNCYGHHLPFDTAETHLHSQDEDWVRFMGQANATYRIETSNLIGGADTLLDVFRSCGPTALASDDNGGVGVASQVEFTAPADDAFDVRISDALGAYGDGKGYDVTVACIADCPSCALPGGDTYPMDSETFYEDSLIEACTGIVSSGNTTIMDTASVTLMAGEYVSIGDSFGVGAGGELTVIVDPSLAAP